MTITIEEELAPTFEFDHKELAEKVILAALAHEGFPYEAEVSLTLTDDESIREINRMHRNIDAVTDVLSFPMISYEIPGDFSKIEDTADDNFNLDTGEALLGDIVLSIPKVIEQAEAYGHSNKREYAFLILHSMLHLFGYDHMTPEDEAFMENRQKEILKDMSILR